MLAQPGGCKVLYLCWVDTGVDQRHFDVSGASDNVEVGHNVSLHIPDEAGPCALGYLHGVHGVEISPGGCMGIRKIVSLSSKMRSHASPRWCP